MADVIAIVADDIATNHHNYYDGVADGIATSMLADVITNI